MNKKIEIVCLVLLGVGLLLVATIVVRSYLARKSAVTPTKQPSYPAAIYAEYSFSQSGSRVKIPVALKISLKDGEPQVMYIKSLAGKQRKLLKVKVGVTSNKGNYVGYDTKGRSYGFYWNKNTSKITHSFSYSTKRGRSYLGRFQKKISAQQWKKLVVTKKSKRKKNSRRRSR